MIIRLKFVNPTNPQIEFAIQCVNVNILQIAYKNRLTKVGYIDGKISQISRNRSIDCCAVRYNQQASPLIVSFTHGWLCPNNIIRYAPSLNGADKKRGFLKKGL